MSETPAPAAPPVGGAGALVLAIGTSCDDTSVEVLERGVTLRSHLIAAQDVHKLYGGVVPELASRAHLELLPPMVARALAEAGVSAGQLTGVAVTNAPGLVGSSSWGWRSPLTIQRCVRKSAAVASLTITTRAGAATLCFVSHLAGPCFVFVKETRFGRRNLTADDIEIRLRD